MFQANQQIGPNTLIRPLGRGAFGEVWLAERRSAVLSRQVALKLLAGRGNDLAAVQREAQIWLQAGHHANVLPVIDADITQEGHVWIASEYASGGSLADWLERHGGRAPSIQVAVDMATGILSGLEHLHSRRPNPIIHRDLKPDNVLLHNDVPRLTDFGISRVMQTVAHTQHFSGTPSFMAPEAFHGHYSAASDIWAMGVLLYNMLTGQLPFPQRDIPSLGYAVAHLGFDPLPSSVQAAVQAVVSKALAKDPDQRFATASAMRVALGARQNVAPSTIVVVREQPAATLPAAPPARRPVQMPPPFLPAATKTNPTDGAEMVYVPGGTFTMGDTDQSDNPPHKVTLTGFHIYKHPVTVAQYRKYCSATGHAMPPAPSWDWKEDHPIVHVNWHDAEAYSKWAGVRLPTEAEWEMGARGTDGRKYPWGNDWDGSKCANLVGANNAKSTAPVGSFPFGASPFGALDMAGNVWEWCQDWYDASYWKPGAAFNNPVNLKNGTSRVVRGGSWYVDVPDDFRASHRSDSGPAYRDDFDGFRCVSQD